MLFPERRQHVRIVTLRNFGWLTIVMLIAFCAITVRSELRGRNSRDYGRLLDRQITVDAPQPKPVETVSEAEPPIADHTPAMTLMPVEPAPQQQTMIPVAVSPQYRAGDSRVAIVGGSDGVAIVQQTQRKPLLKGGFGRNP